ncbi:MAG: EamA family transporter [Rhodocyclaceae bacterium]|nr:EamA family transporter [Rhodocyclaceae bacterium]MBP6108330.1 EamA family transporter [Rhodocyclaceae bacterium]MBP6278346.1 EamA family transporter [Rhodocyclaceae bacterium]
MSDRFLFWMPTLIWATTWHVILYEIGEVPALYSVAMRFALAAVMLFAIAGWRGESLHVSKNVHPWLALTGALQYGLNYVGTYESERYLPSGLVAVLFSLMIFTNAIGGALFLAQPIARRIAIGGCMGVTGVALIFWPDITAAGANPNAWLGIGLGLMAVTFASLGNILTLRISREGMALVPLLAWSMAYGALVVLLIAWVSGVPFVADPRPSYWIAMIYLSAFGSVAAFLLYFKLAQRQGPARAGLMGMVIPVIALGVSAVLEDWRPTPIAGLGIALCLGGLWSATRRAAAN